MPGGAGGKPAHGRAPLATTLLTLFSCSWYFLVTRLERCKDSCDASHYPSASTTEHGAVSHFGVFFSFFRDSLDLPATLAAVWQEIGPRPLCDPRRGGPPLPSAPPDPAMQMLPGRSRCSSGCSTLLGPRPAGLRRWAPPVGGSQREPRAPNSCTSRLLHGARLAEADPDTRSRTLTLPVLCDLPLI